MSRCTGIHRLEWNGILLELTYEPQWLLPNIVGEHVAHLAVRSIHPEDAPLPITETGYRSHFIAASAVDAAGGPVAYVGAWLIAESKSKAWRERERSARQFDLFGARSPQAIACGDARTRDSVLWALAV